MKSFICRWFCLLLFLLPSFLPATALLAGNEEQSAVSPKSEQADAPQETKTPATEAEGPKKDACSVCAETGILECRSPGCHKGQKKCPNPCLKLSDPGWIHMEVAGHPKTDIWHKVFYYQNGQQTWQAYNQAHVGDIINPKTGADTGKCPVCGGKTEIACKLCNGTGKVPCWACDGAKVFSISDENRPFVDAQGKPDPVMKLAVVQLFQQAFPFVLDGISDGAEGKVFSISHRGGATSFKVKLQEEIPDSKYPGYKLLSFTPKFEDRADPTIKGPDGKPYLKKIDASEVILQKGDETPITLAMGKTAVMLGRYSAKLYFKFQDLSFVAEPGTAFSLLENRYQVVRVRQLDSAKPEVVVKRVDSGKEFCLPLFASKG